MRTTLGLFIAVSLVSGVLGTFAGEPVATVLGNALNHHELPLRIAGWCWGGLPFVLLVLLLHFRTSLHQGLRLATGYVLTTWIATGWFLIPSRASSLQSRLGTAAADMRPVTFAWATGVLPVIAVALLLLIVVLILKRSHGTLSKQALHRMSTWLLAVWITFTAAGLLAALAAPLP
ncbi:hypothetical protein AB0E69_33020 [Kribbella sp. NPDC026611]|uniref:hypothetical protein n=1 Tax=Kribbella sp. NPDC026611 TaxID=3154911 RepID=UPI00340DCD8D